MKKIFFNKKAQYDLLDFIFQIVIVVAVGAALVLHVSERTGETAYKRMYLARELAFDTGALYAAPGNILYNTIYYFPYDIITVFDYDFRKDNIAEVSVSRYYYPSDSCFTEYPKLIEKEEAASLYITNSNYELFFGQDIEDFNRHKLKYPFVDTHDLNWKTKRFVVVSGKYAGILKDMGLDISLYSEEDMAGYFNIIDNGEKPGEIKVLIPVKTALKSRKLASIMINRFLDANNNLKVSVGFSEDEIMNGAEVSFSLIAGADTGLNIADVVFKSLEEYYEEARC